MSSAKLEKVLARQKAKIEEGDYYEAHQQLRTIANRYVKAGDYAAAIDLLASGAGMLLRAGQGGSGADLCVYLIEVYAKAGVRADGETINKARLVTLLRAFPPREPGKKKFVGGVVEWSTKTSPYPAGDPDLHHVIGTLYAAEGDAYEAEPHFVLGTSESAPAFADLLFRWYGSDEPSTAAHYAARAVFPYLLIYSPRGANAALARFVSRLTAAHPALGSQSIASPSADVRIFPSLPLLNFLALLLLAVQRGGADVFRQLKTHYAAHLKEVPAWTEPLQHVGEKYFGVKIPTAGGGNPMLDMMTTMMMGGNNPFAAARGNAAANRQVQGPPPPGVD